MRRRKLQGAAIEHRCAEARSKGGSVAMSKSTAIVLAPTQMDSESLGILVRDGLVGGATKLVELKPAVEELCSRFEKSEVILGCSTRKQFCQQVLQRTP